MTITKMLLASGAALLLSAGVAAAAPASVRTDLNVRSGPGTQYPVVGSIPAGETVDVGSCTGSWCQVSFSGGSGFANRSYLAMADGAPSVGVAVAPSYGYEDSPAYATDDYYDYGYSYGPSVGFYGGGPRFRHGFHHRGQWDGNRTGTWQGRPGGWSGARTGTWQGQPGGAIGARPGGFQGRPGGAAFNQPGSVSPRVSAPTGMRAGGAPGGGMAVGGGARMGGGAAMGGGGPRGGGGAAVGGGAGRPGARQ
jgi:uncharacterized protein YraI